MAKHYIRTDGIFIMKTFTTDFEQPLKDDICVNEDGGRHFILSLLRDDGLPRYKYYHKKIIETNDKDLTGQINSLKLERELKELDTKLREAHYQQFKDSSSIPEAIRIREIENLQ